MSDFQTLWGGVSEFNKISTLFFIASWKANAKIRHQALSMYVVNLLKTSWSMQHVKEEMKACLINDYLVLERKDMTKQSKRDDQPSKVD